MSTSTTASPSGTAEEVYDLLGIGFGPAGLAIAVAVAEHNAAAPGESIATPPEFTSLGGLQEVLGRSKSCAQLPGNEGDRTELDITKWTGTIKACFVEKYDQFRWHPGMMIEGSKMQIS
ncbi:L-ornithine N5-oxygenase [Pseudohyphozyma bogoriensis]|nr:L-ornithine N5-oxygenase [Pseudohyphozyma bogoriensis]